MWCCCFILRVELTLLTQFYENVPLAVLGLHLETGGPSCRREKGPLAAKFLTFRQELPLTDVSCEQVPDPVYKNTFLMRRIPL